MTRISPPVAGWWRERHGGVGIVTGSFAPVRSLAVVWAFSRPGEAARLRQILTGEQLTRGLGQLS